MFKTVNTEVPGLACQWNRLDLKFCIRTWGGSSCVLGDRIPELSKAQCFISLGWWLLIIVFQVERIISIHYA